jgi:uncharacterized protein
LGLRQVRVRHHGSLARIETDETGFALLTSRDAREKTHEALKQLGFTYVSLDLLGYRTGSMNETIDTDVGVTIADAAVAGAITAGAANERSSAQ